MNSSYQEYSEILLFVLFLLTGIKETRKDRRQVAKGIKMRVLEPKYLYNDYRRTKPKWERS